MIYQAQRKKSPAIILMDNCIFLIFYLGFFVHFYFLFLYLIALFHLPTAQLLMGYISSYFDITSLYFYTGLEHETAFSSVMIKYFISFLDILIESKYLFNIWLYIIVDDLSSTISLLKW